jgi:MoaA/NifB/PqqE/SkfB family radical SAM enzyme
MSTSKMYPIKEGIKNIDSIDLEKIKRLALWVKGKKQYPVMAELYPTQRCNLRCVYCWQRNEENKEKIKELKTADWINIIRELGKAGTKRALITGGEPLCRDDISTILEALKKEGIEGHLVTNGTLFDKGLIQLLVNLKWDSVAFSLDSADPEINDSLRGKDSFKKVIKAIGMFNKAKNGKSSKPLLSINTTLTDKNYKRLPDLVKLAKKLNLAYISILPLVAYHEQGQKLLIGKQSKRCLDKSLKEAYNLADGYGIANSINDIIEKDLIQKSHDMDTVLKDEYCDKNTGFNPVCFHPFVLLTVKEDGSVSPCPVSGIKGERFEKNKNLDSLWFGETFTRFREAMLNHNTPSCCSICCIPKVLETKELERQVKSFLEQEERWKKE